MIKYFHYGLSVILIIAALTFQQACGSRSELTADEHDHDSMEAPSDEVHLTVEQAQNIALTFAAITSRKIRSLVKLSGRVELPPAGKAYASSSLQGKVTSVHAIAGQSVGKGQRLFTIENLDIIDWQEQVKIKQAELDFVNKELARQRQLNKEEIAPTKNYESLLAQKLQHEASISATKAKLAAIGIEPSEAIQTSFSILAPAAGIVQHLLVSNGQFVDASTPLAEIINNHHLHLHLVAFGKDVTVLDKDQILNFFVQSRPSHLLQAKIMWINAMVDQDNNSYDVHAEIIDDHRELSAGEFVEARVINQELSVNTLPLEAVNIDKGLYYIFVREDATTEEIHFKKLQVQIGESDLGFVEILPVDPLPELGKSIIAVEGSFFLMAESKKGEVGAGHSH
jgi:cobalt-zinc-cadmium efflux system membrane fusion protein